MRHSERQEKGILNRKSRDKEEKEGNAAITTATIDACQTASMYE